MKLNIVTASGSKTTYKVESEEEAMKLIEEYVKEKMYIYSATEIEKPDNIEATDGSKLITIINFTEEYGATDGTVKKHYKGTEFLWSD